MSNIYMKIDEIKGSVTNKEYNGWIALNSAFYETSRDAVIETGRAYDRELAKATFSEMEITKVCDAASTQLFQKMCSGKTIPKIVIHIVYTGKSLQPYVKLELENVIISRYEDDMKSGTIPSETLSLSYTKIHKTYISRDQSNQASTPFVVGYNIEEAAVI